MAELQFSLLLFTCRDQKKWTKLRPKPGSHTLPDTHTVSTAQRFLDQSGSEAFYTTAVPPDI